MAAEAGNSLVAEWGGGSFRKLRSGARLRKNWAATYQGAINIVHVFIGTLDGTPRADGRELIEVRFFPPDGLPAELGDRVRRQLDKAGI
jgi:hypothetical protein